MNWTPATPITSHSAPLAALASTKNSSFCTILVQCKFFRINTCKSVSKQRTLTPFRMNTYEKTGGVGEGQIHVSPTTDRSDALLSGFLRRSVMISKVRTWMMPALAGLALVYVQVGAGQQQDQDFSKVQIKTTKVSGNIYMLEGAGGNIAASVGEDGIVIVDDQFAPLAEKIQAALKELKITDKPVRFVINTHYHGDHTGGESHIHTPGPHPTAPTQTPHIL